MPSLQELRRKRELANDWITYASWTAIVTAALGGITLLTAILQDASSLPWTVALIPGLVGQIAFGLKMRERSFWAGTALMTTYLYSAVIHSLSFGLLSGILLKVLIAIVYVRGFMAVDAYHEAEKAIAAAALSESPRGSAASGTGEGAVI